MIPYLDFPSNLVGMKASACHRPRPCQTGWTSHEYTLLRLINSNYTISLFWNGHFQFHTPQIWAQNQGWILNRYFYCISGNGEGALERERRMPLYSDVPDINVRGEGGEPNSLWAPYVRRTQICNIKILSFPFNAQHACARWVWSFLSFVNSGNVFSFIFKFPLFPPFSRIPVWRCLVFSSYFLCLNLLSYFLPFYSFPQRSGRIPRLHLPYSHTVPRVCPSCVSDYPTCLEF